MKVIINVADNFIPNDNDILVYDKHTDLWLTKNIEVITKKQDEKISALTKENEEIKVQFNDLKKKHNQILEIVKESVKNG